MTHCVPGPVELGGGLDGGLEADPDAGLDGSGAGLDEPGAGLDGSGAGLDEPDGGLGGGMTPCAAHWTGTVLAGHFGAWATDT